MEIVFAIVLMLLAWGTLLLSWFLWEQKFICVLLAMVSMILFFTTAGALVYTTQGYAGGDPSAGTFMTGEMHLTSYQPYAMLFVFFGLLSMVWLFARLFDWIMEALYRNGWLIQ
jgi:hypothetical protein